LLLPECKAPRLKFRTAQSRFRNLEFAVQNFNVEVQSLKVRVHNLSVEVQNLEVEVPGTSTAEFRTPMSEFITSKAEFRTSKAKFITSKPEFRTAESKSGTSKLGYEFEADVRSRHAAAQSVAREAIHPYASARTATVWPYPALDGALNFCCREDREGRLFERSEFASPPSLRQKFKESFAISGAPFFAYFLWQDKESESAPAGDETEMDHKRHPSRG
jgi:hypothetical protein